MAPQSPSSMNIFVSWKAQLKAHGRKYSINEKQIDNKLNKAVDELFEKILQTPQGKIWRNKDPSEVENDLEWADWYIESQIWSQVVPPFIPYPGIEPKSDVPKWLGIKDGDESITGNLGSMSLGLQHAPRGGRGGANGRGRGRGGARGGSINPPNFYQIQQEQQRQQRQQHRQNQQPPRYPQNAAERAQKYHWPHLDEKGCKLYATTLPKDIRSFLGPHPSYHKNLVPVELNYGCKVEFEDLDGAELEIWAQSSFRGGKADDPGVKACGDFLLEFREEVQFTWSQGSQGPRIDLFLKDYLKDGFLTVEQRKEIMFKPRTNAPNGSNLTVEPSVPSNNNMTPQPAVAVDNAEMEKHRLANMRNRAQEERRRRSVIDEVSGSEMLFEAYLSLRDARVVAAARQDWFKQYSIDPTMPLPTKLEDQNPPTDVEDTEEKKKKKSEAGE